MSVFSRLHFRLPRLAKNFCLLLVGAFTLKANAPLQAQEIPLAIGTYTQNAQEGLCLAGFDPTTGELSAVRVAAGTPNPSFLAWHPSGLYLYAVNEGGVVGGQNGGGLSAFQYDKATGRFTLLNDVSYQGGVCHLSVDATGKFLLAATYGGGNAASFALGTDGRIGQRVALVQHEGSGTNPARQESPHAHQVVFSPDNRFAFVVDLGIDKLMSYHFDANSGQLAPNGAESIALAPGSGARHMAFAPNSRYLYVANELNNTVVAFDYDAATGTGLTLQTLSTLPADFAGSSSVAEIAVHPNGRFLYVSNRGADNLARFAIDQENGQLTLSGFTPTDGKNPRHFTIDPTGKWLLAANQDSQSIVVFRIDQETGALAKTSEIDDVPGKPVCLSFAPQP